MKSSTHFYARILIALTAVAAAQNVAFAASYHFENVVDNSGGSGFNILFFAPPAMNNSGTIAFRGQLGPPTGGFAMFRTTGSTTTKLADSAGALSGFDFRYSINNSGEVAFLASLDGGGAQLLTSDGSALTNIAQTVAGGFTSIGPPGSINDHGVVAFRASSTTISPGVYIGDGSSAPTKLVSISTFQGEPSINNMGDVVYVQNGVRVIESDGAPDTLIAGPADGFGTIFGVDMNDAGTVFIDGGSSFAQKLVTVSGGIFTPLADTTGDFFGFDSDRIAINNDGDVAFFARLDSDERGIFVGGDPLADKLIVIGDSLFGSTVTRIDFNHGLNDSGDVAFGYVLANGQQGVAIASLESAVIPTPAATLIGLIGFGLLGVRRPQRSTGPQQA